MAGLCSLRGWTEHPVGEYGGSGEGREQCFPHTDTPSNQTQVSSLMTTGVLSLTCYVQGAIGGDKALTMPIFAYLSQFDRVFQEDEEMAGDDKIAPILPAQD